MRTVQPHAADAASVLAELDVRPDSGLSPSEVSERLATFGRNALPPPKTPALWRRITAQLSSPIVLTLLAAAVISLMFGAQGAASDGVFARYSNTLAILLIVALNATLGLVQESKAGRAVAALGKMSVPRARVRRSGEAVTVSAEELVPGDVLELEGGDLVSADARLIEATELEVDEATLTGESVPVRKDPSFAGVEATPLADRLNMLFLGTAITAGLGTAVVTATGAQTELGRIGGMLAAATKAATPLEEMLEAFGRRVLLGCLALSGILFAWGLLKPVLIAGATPEPWAFVLLGAVSLAVAAIPEGLRAITTITLALGTQRLAKRGAIVRRLPAVETLGAATFICTDKTGTLTENVMMVRSVWTLGGVYSVEGDGYGPHGLVRRADDLSNAAPGALSDLVTAALVCNHAAIEQLGDAWRAVGDPTEAALVTLGARAGFSAAEVRRARPVVQEIPFESARRRMTVITETGDQRTLWMKGALDVVVARCTSAVDGMGTRPLDADLQKSIELAAEEMARRGLRVLAFAYRRGGALHEEAGLTFLGLVGIMDPPRPGVADALASCRRAGITVAMITGDHPTTAAAIASEIGLFAPGDLALSGVELDALSDEELAKSVERVRIFARTSPEQKLRIMHALKARGHVVAMTGDGVNDAPALRAAHIGVAMGRGGTEVARQAADLVLADDDFSTIVAAIREGRVIYRNIQKFILFLLSANAGLCGAVFLTALIADWPPFTPLMLLWINLVTNGLPALALGVDPPGEDVMAGTPRKVGEPILGGKDWAAIGVVGLLMTASSAFFHVHSAGPEAMLKGRSLGFTYLALGALLHAYSCSSRDSVIFKLSTFRRPLTLAVVISAVVQSLTFIPAVRPVFKTYPPDLMDLVKLCVLCLLVVPVFETWKWVTRR